MEIASDPADMAPDPADVASLPATGERTAPGLPDEEYWFARHLVAYRWIADRLEGGVIVDAGAGEGYGAAMLSAVALEYDAAACRHARATYPDIAVAQANLAALPLRTGSADAITCLQVVEHLWDLSGFLRDCRRALKPGGQLILTTPQRLTFSPGLERGEKPVNPFHVEEFDAKQIHDMLADAGFDRVELRGVHHGSRLSEWETQHGSLIAAQVEAALHDDTPPALREFVSGITPDDFIVDAQPQDSGGDHLQLAQDLLAVAWSVT